VSRTVPIILIIPLAVAVYLADPIRHKGTMVDPSAYEAGIADLIVETPGWTRTELSETLPRAFPPHNAYLDKTTQYQYVGAAGLPGGDSPSATEAFLRIVIVQDRRDLLAFDPIQAMRAGGWTGRAGQRREGFRRTIHGRGPGQYGERVTLDTIYVVPGAWGADPQIIAEAGRSGPGWPGPGAIVQLLLNGGGEQGEAPGLSEAARRVAEALARSLPDGDQP
jgi:hypothetical protein